MRRYGARSTVSVFVLALGCDDTLVPSDTTFSVPEDEVFADTRPDVAPGPGEGRIYVTNSLSDTVSVLDLDAVGTADLRVIATVPVGFNTVEREGPHHVIAHPDGEHYLVGISNYVPGSGSGPHGVHGAGTADGHALKMRVRDNLLVGSVRVDRSPGDIRLTPDGRTLVMSHFDLLAINDAIREDDPALAVARFAIIDVETMERRAMVDLCAGGHGIALSPDSTRAFVSCLGDELAIIDLVAADHPVTRLPVIDAPGTIAAPTCYPYAITAAPGGDAVFVSCFQTGQVRVFDNASGTIDPDRSFQLVGGAMFGTFSADGTRVFMPHQEADGVTIVDAATGDIERILPLGLDGCVKAHVARLTEDEERLMVVCEGDHGGPGSFVVVNVASGAVEHTVELGVFPDDIAIVRRPR